MVQRGGEFTEVVKHGGGTEIWVIAPSFAHAASDAKCSETLCLVGLGAGVTVGQACCYVSVTPVVIPL